MKFIIDMDGVLYRDSNMLPYADKFIKFLQERRIEFVFATNNSTKTREMFVEKLAKMNILVDKSRIITSSWATAQYLKKFEGKGRAIIVGEIGLVEEIRRIGWEILSTENWKKATHVIVGMDRTLTYEKLKAGCLAIYNDAKFIASNDDRNFPSAEGIIPGAGSMVAALEAATGKKAFVIGKPNDPYIQILKNVLGEGEYWVVGDRTDTDMLMADKLNAKKVLILTGIAKEPSGKEDFIFRNLEEFLNYLREIL